jgi:hypothetical protein
VRTRWRVASAALAVAAVAAAGFGVWRLRPPTTEPTARAAPTATVTVTAPIIPAAAVAGIEATGHPLAGAVVLVHDDRASALEGGSALRPGDRVVVPADGRASVALSTGTHVLVEGGSDFGVADLGVEQRFALRGGAMRADVAKLGPGQRFVLRTADAEVEVRGTSFRVEVLASAACGTATRVSVTEGTVVVRERGTEERVTAGEQWPRGCAPTTPTAMATASPSAPVRAPFSASDLAEQNRLLGDATNARRRGAVGDAIASYDAYLARWPTGQGAEGAMVERMRLVAATGKPAGATAAREYLRRYPHGYAQKEAADLAASAP